MRIALQRLATVPASAAWCALLLLLGPLHCELLLLLRRVQLRPPQRRAPSLPLLLGLHGMLQRLLEPHRVLPLLLLLICVLPLLLVPLLLRCVLLGLSL